MLYTVQFLKCKQFNFSCFSSPWSVHLNISLAVQHSCPLKLYLHIASIELHTKMIKLNRILADSINGA